MAKIFSPFNQKEINDVQLISAEESEVIFSDANQAQKKWQLSAKEDRLQVLEKFCDYLLKNKDHIGEQITVYMGRPIRFSAKEVETAVARAKEVMKVFKRLEFTQKIDEQREIHQLPLGNILVFGAWNYPVLTAINSIAPAILAGNSVCFRPSLQTFFIGDVFQRAFEIAGLMDGVFQVCPFSHEETEQVVQSKKIQSIVYTGSTLGGRKIHRWSGGNFIPVTMELGGKDAAYIRADADVENAAVNVADGAFFNSGQSCCGVERVFVHESIYQDVLNILIREAKSLRLGDPINKDTTLGPMAKESAVNFLKSHLAQAKKKGAITHLDELGELNPYGQFIRPEIITNVEINSAIQKEETFGPFVTIVPVKSDEEAIEMINNSSFGLTASIWTSDVNAMRSAAVSLEVGVVLFNRCDFVDPKLPWRGEKETGMGQALGPDCFNSYLKPRSLFQN